MKFKLIKKWSEQFVYGDSTPGVFVGRTVPESQVQLSLFDTLDRDKRREVNSVVDTINRKMGRDKVKLAVQGSSRKWKLKQEKLSPCYTTRFEDMLEVVI